jgi:putative mRNA 3-end processing factor
MNWWQRNKEEGRISILMGYPLGKSQHLLAFLSEFQGNIFVHHETALINQVIRSAGARLAMSFVLTRHTREEELRGALIIVPPAVRKSPWLYQLKNYSLAMVSGWVSVKRGRQQTLFGDSGFALSDHADFTGLIEAVTATRAERVISMHGYAEQFARSLNEMGFKAEKAMY